MELPKYAICEIERRWQVRPEVLEQLAALPFTKITDLYIYQAQIRLRCMEKLSGEKIYKLCKKYGKINVISEPITNIYLSELEYNLLKILPGAKITKRRYKLAGGNLDVFPEESKIAPVFEIEFASEDDAQNYVPPEFVTIEITGNDALSGASLARGRA